VGKHRIVDCKSRWYIKLPVGFKGLIIYFSFSFRLDKEKFELINVSMCAIALVRTTIFLPVLKYHESPFLLMYSVCVSLQETVE
jgi:hypothetical protein